MALPANVGYCQVSGRFIQAVLDGTDLDRDPDGIAIPGLSIVLTASVSRVKDLSASPPVTIQLAPISLSTDTDGTLVDAAGATDVFIVASDDPDLSPTGWTYTATVSAPTVPKYSFSFVAPWGGVVDLSTVVEVPPAPGTELTDWQLAVSETEANVAAAQQAATDAENAAGRVVVLTSSDPIPAGLPAGTLIFRTA
jgi:hypothetical protein